MGDLLLPTEVFLGLVALLLLSAGAVFARRRTIAHGDPLIICGIREHGSARWRIGLARFGTSSLYWFTLAGPSLRPSRRWSRGLLRLGPPRDGGGDQRLAVIPDSVVVDCTCAEQRFQLALGVGPHTALVSWLEAVPPGSNVPAG